MTPHTAPMSPPEFALVPLTSIVTSPTNPRKSFDADKLNELASTIRASGVHTPILLRYLPPARLQETFTDRKKGAKLPEYEIVAGERRYRASFIAGVATIPALIRAMSDQQALEVQMIENLQRDDLSELEEADGYQQLCELTNISKEAIAEKIGRSRRYVYDRLRLLKLQPLARTALAGGKISATAALAIATVHDGDLQAKALAHALDVDYKGDQPSTRDLQRWMRQNVMLDLSKATFDIKLATLYPKAGACTTCPKRTGADPDLFAETQGPDMCCDAPCYHVKAEAARVQAREKYKAEGIPVICGEDAMDIGISSLTKDMRGYSPAGQTREDTTSGKPTTLRDLLGKQGQAAVGLVAIENPDTHELRVYFNTQKAEKYLLDHKLIVEAPPLKKPGKEARMQTLTAHTLERQVDALLARKTDIEAELVEIHQKIKRLQIDIAAQVNAAKSSTPNAPLAQPKAGAGAKPKKAKLTKQEAQLGIADAMQEAEEVGAAAPAKFTKGQRVKVIAAGATYLEKWIGKTGKVKQACGDNFDVAFYGGGIAEFEPQELEASE